ASDCLAAPPDLYRTEPGRAVACVQFRDHPALSTGALGEVLHFAPALSPGAPCDEPFQHSRQAGETGAPPRESVGGDRRFVVELIKPSHYDDDGYLIQWWKSWIPSNSLACLYGIAADLAERRALGAEVAIEVRAYDECHTVISVGRIIQRIGNAD